MSIPALGTPHAVYFYGDISCARELSEEEVIARTEKIVKDAKCVFYPVNSP